MLVINLLMMKALNTGLLQFEVSGEGSAHMFVRWMGIRLLLSTITSAEIDALAATVARNAR